MKKLHTLLLSVGLLLGASLRAEESIGGSPFSFLYQLGDENLPTVTTPGLDSREAAAKADEAEKNGKPYQNGVTFPLNISPKTAGQWFDLPNGDRLWKIKIKSPGAVGLFLYVNNFQVPEGARIYVYNGSRTQAFGAYTAMSNRSTGVFIPDVTMGEEQVVEYYEPLRVAGQGDFVITEVAHLFRSEGYSTNVLADPCEVDVNCSEGANYTDQKKGVVRIQVKIGSGTYLCSGSLVNNTALDCKKYILTAAHCTWASTTQQASTADLNQWVFWFGRERANCGSGTIPTNLSMTGCTKRSDASTGMNSLGSDFYLVELNSTNFPTNYSTPYYNGWTNATAAPTTGGVGIHHPAGSEKKISTFSQTPVSATWSGSPSGAHWQFSWIQTTNGWGVTEGGSSGSPVFNSSGLIFGTLTGGASYCNAVVAGANDDPDYYGKMSYHWTSNSTQAAKQLKPWLDPLNSGNTTLSGLYPPCTTTSVDEQVFASLFTVYPNPSSGIYNIQVAGTTTMQLRYEIYDVTGRMLDGASFNTADGRNLQLNLGDYTTGIYLLKISNGKTIHTQRLLLNK
jgi:hypothetical protein